MDQKALIADVAKTRAILAGILASTPSLAAETPPGGSDGGAVDTTAPHTPTSDDGGKQPPNSSHGGGGGNGSGKKKDGWMKNLSFLETLILAIVSMTILTSIGAFVNMQYMKWQIQMEEIMYKNDKIRIENDTLRKNLENSATQPPQPQVKILSTFSCAAGEEEQKRQGFARMDIQNVNTNNVSYKIPSGCAWIRVSAEVQSFTGTDYVFVMDDPSYPTGKGCGTYNMIDGRSRSNDECRRFLNENAGHMIRVYVKGVVFIN